MIEPFRGDEQGAFPPGYFLSFSFVFLCFCSFIFSGVIRGQRPFIVLFRHSRNLLSGIHIFASSFRPSIGNHSGVFSYYLDS